jgi:hypothetical protein
MQIDLILTIVQKMETGKFHNARKIIACIIINITLSTLLLFALRNLRILNSLLFEQILIATFFGGLCTYLTFRLRAKKSVNLYPYFLVGSLVFLIGAQDTVLNIDRSRSFYTLGWVDQDSVRYKDGELDLSAVKSTEKFSVPEISVRLNEQVSRGLVYIDSDKVRLTSSGRFMLGLANGLGKIFALDNWKANSR